MAMVPRAVLWVPEGPGEGTGITLSEGMMLVGRAPHNDIIVEEPGVSRQHAGIRGDRNGYWIQDIGSRNGTYVNGVPVEGEGQRLRNMDRIEFGGTNSRVQWIFREVGATVDNPQRPE